LDLGDVGNVNSIGDDAVGARLRGLGRGPYLRAHPTSPHCALVSQKEKRKKKRKNEKCVSRPNFGAHPTSPHWKQ